MKKTLVTIVGPTAIGKTAMAIAVASRFSTEIISADSRQFFKEMEIGTAKPSPEELRAVKHHFINSHSVTTLFSTGDFEIEGLKLIQHLFKYTDVLVLVGGSGLYVDAICQGLDILPPTSLSIRDELNKILLYKGIDEIRTQLKILDPEYFEKVDQNNPQRMIRGLEFVLSTGEKLSGRLTYTKKSRPFNILKIGLNTDRKVLYKRINSRVDQMIDTGLLSEVKNLKDFKHYNALNTVGYSELFEHLEGRTSLDQAIEKIKQNTRRFAKRQLTWFRKDKDIKWFEPDEIEAVIQYIREKIN